MPARMRASILRWSTGAASIVNLGGEILTVFSSAKCDVFGRVLNMLAPLGLFALAISVLRLAALRFRNGEGQFQMESEVTRVLIAGAGGLVGSALVPALIADGKQVTRLVRSSPREGELEWHPNQDEIDTATLDG